MTNKLRAILVDDEQDSLSLLQLQLEKYCPNIEVAGAYTDTTVAVAAIQNAVPDIVFTDIEMPVMNGFELLEKTLQVGFSVIFITAYNQYALKAFRFSALDYLVKPIEAEDLINAVARAREKIKPAMSQINTIRKQMQGEQINKIGISSQTGISFIGFDEILYVEASNNYSKIYVAGGAAHIISRTLKDVQDVLEESHFMRIHRQYIVNLNHAMHFNRNDSVLTMNNKAELPVARNQKERLIARYGML